MNKGDKVKWQDLVTGRTRYGVLDEQHIVVAESQPINDLSEQPRFRDVNRESWDVIEDGTGYVFALGVGTFEVIKPN